MSEREIRNHGKIFVYRNYPGGHGADCRTGVGAAGGSTYFTADHQLRASKIVGASVYDDHNQSVGSIDDVLMSEGDHKVASAVISVGGFLGIRSKLVAVPFEKLQMVDDKIVLSGATKASLEGMAEYHYTNA